MPPENKTSPTENVLRMAEKTHRDIAVIESDLGKAKFDWVVLEAKNRDYNAMRQRKLKRREEAGAKWQKENPGEPFDLDGDYAVPPEDTPDTRSFHKLHYTIAGLQKELEEAKRASTL